MKTIFRFSLKYKKVLHHQERFPQSETDNFRSNGCQHTADNRSHLRLPVWVHCGYTDPSVDEGERSICCDERGVSSQLVALKVEGPATKGCVQPPDSFGCRDVLPAFTLPLTLRFLHNSEIIP